MKTVVPDYYSAFRCKAEKCRHTCCAGWEIDIDEETYEFYRGLGGETGEKLRDSISPDDDPHFILQGTDERCPMLSEDGLCRLISEYGEEALCQICADHPRFRNYFSDRTEIGLGLCCEAAGELILGKKDKVRLVTLSDDGEEQPLTAGERHLFDLREKMLGIVQNRHLPVRQRMKRLLALSGISDEREIRQLVELFLDLERLDEKWTQALVTLRETDFSKAPDSDEAMQTVFEQFAVYLIYRYTPYLNRKAAVLSISAMFRLFEHLCFREIMENDSLDFEQAVEIARLLSSEVEYSDENVGRLFAGQRELPQAGAAVKVRYIGLVDCCDLTYGSVYECLGLEHGCYRIVDESEEDYLYPTNEFELVEQ